MKTLLHSKQFDVVVQRLVHQLIENIDPNLPVAIIGIQPRGIALSDRVYKIFCEAKKNTQIQYGKLDITMYRDDFRSEAALKQPAETDINFNIEGMHVVLIDDVLYTGRTIRCALDAILDYGRPAKVELMVLIDRRFSRHLPIQADYVGKSIDSITTQKVKVHWKEKDKKDEVVLIDN